MPKTKTSYTPNLQLLMNITILDGYTLNPGDLNWSMIEQLGDTTIYDRTSAEQVVERAKNADILLSNKVVLSKIILDQLPRLKCIVVMASGYNNIDVEAAKERAIPVCNASGYSTPGVAQHVFVLILACLNKVETYNQSVQNGDWSKSPDFCYTLNSIHELTGKTLGIYGLGKIGNKVVDIALAFDMKVLATHKHPIRDAREGVSFVDLESLFEQSDFISLHAPLNESNQQIVDRDLLSKMKSTAYLINTGRGGLIQELDLKEALENGQLAGAALDVLSSEPPQNGNPLIGTKNCILTPHVAWASFQSRERLMQICADNIKGFLENNLQNVVNGV
ncbi:MAG: D-2-hydroxyacid dehydrogenase [Bacteroidota bacterium]